MAARNNIFLEQYEEFDLIAQYIPRENHWRGYMTSPDEDLIYSMEDIVHGGFTHETSLHSLIREKYIKGKYVPRYSMIGFDTGAVHDVNRGPEDSEELKLGIWNKSAVFHHLKSIIKTGKEIAETRRDCY